MEWGRIGRAAFLTVDEQREAAGYGPMGKGAKRRGGPDTLRYSRDQPRVAAGSPEGGQWTDGNGGSGEGLTQVALNTIANVVSDAGVTLIGQIGDLGRYVVDLQAEEGYSHAIRDHVGKSDDELLDVPQNFGAVRYKPRVGSFDSRESANDFVNRTLEYKGPGRLSRQWNKGRGNSGANIRLCYR